MTLTNAEAKDYFDNSLLDGSLWLAAFTADPTRSGLLTNEVSTSGTAYARAEVTGLFTATNLTKRIALLNALLEWATPTASWGTLTHFGLMDAETPATGTMKAKTRVDKNIVLTVGVPLVLLPGQVKFLVP